MFSPRAMSRRGNVHRWQGGGLWGICPGGKCPTISPWQLAVGEQTTRRHYVLQTGSQLMCVCWVLQSRAVIDCYCPAQHCQSSWLARLPAQCWLGCDSLLRLLVLSAVWCMGVSEEGQLSPAVDGWVTVTAAACLQTPHILHYKLTVSNNFWGLKIRQIKTRQIYQSPLVRGYRSVIFSIG